MVIFMSKTISLLAGLDIGNGYVKAKINDGDAFDLPSVVACVTSTHDIKAEDVKAVVDDIFNHMDASFDSPLIETPGSRRFFGRRGITAGMSIQEFDVFSHVSKANNDLSGILVLGTLAGYALQQYYAEHGALPMEQVTVHCRIALALPINEYKRHREAYANKFKKASSLVTIHNFEKPVRIELVFDNVQVFAEGESAQYGILIEGEPLMAEMLADVRNGGEPLEGIAPADVLAAKTVVGIDIGEGTTNFPVFLNRKFNADASSTYKQGYGEVLTRAMERLADMGMAFHSRKDITEFLLETPTALNRAKHERIKMVVSEETVPFAQAVSMEFAKVMNRGGVFIEVVYVYGGGATLAKDVLHPLILQTIRSFSDDQMPVLYLDSQYSRFLNATGLYRVAAKLAERV